MNLRKDHSYGEVSLHRPLVTLWMQCGNTLVLASGSRHNFDIHLKCLFDFTRELQPVALDPLACHSMKTVAKCDKWCDMQVQNLYVNHRIVERTASSLTQERYAPLSVIMSSRLVVIIDDLSGFGIHDRKVALP